MGIKKIEEVSLEYTYKEKRLRGELKAGITIISKDNKYFIELITLKDVYITNEEKPGNNDELTNDSDSADDIAFAKNLPEIKRNIWVDPERIYEKKFKGYINNKVFRLYKIIKIMIGAMPGEKIDEKPVLYLYNSWIYRTDREYTTEEVKLMILELEDKERIKFERLKKKHSLSETIEKKPKREVIPEEVRVAVWRRDEGKCSKCGSREKLEYDHIIPISKGGSNTVRNIELLCEHCNRKKSANIE